VQANATDSILKTVSQSKAIQYSELRSKAQFTPIPRTTKLQITYRSPVERDALDMVNAIGNAYLSALNHVQTNAPELNRLRTNMEGAEADLRAAASASASEAYMRAKTDRISKEAAYEAVNTGRLAALLASPKGNVLKKLLDQRAEVQAGSALEQKREIDAQISNTRKTIVRAALAELEQAKVRETILARELAAGASHSATTDRLMKLAQRAIDARTRYEAMLHYGHARIIESARLITPNNHPMRWTLLAWFITAVPFSLYIFAGSPEVRIRKPEELSGVTGVRTLALIPAVPAWRQSVSPHLLARTENLAGDEAAYRAAIQALRSSIETTLSGANRGAILITSALPSEGRSTVAANLASAFADAGKRTLLIDADLHRPALDKLFGRGPVGLTGILSGKAEWRECIVESPTCRHLHYLPAGPIFADTGDFDGHAFRLLLDEAHAHYDVVLVDGPPFLNFPQTVDLALSTDFVIVSARGGYVTQRDLGILMDYLNRLQARMLGAVYCD
jgi:capsular exopolysaccharide synthesis family protein